MRAGGGVGGAGLYGVSSRCYQFNESMIFNITINFSSVDHNGKSFSVAIHFFVTQFVILVVLTMPMTSTLYVEVL